jgi:hypothetical protein
MSNNEGLGVEWSRHHEQTPSGDISPAIMANPQDLQRPATVTFMPSPSVFFRRRRLTGTGCRASHTHAHTGEHTGIPRSGSTTPGTGLPHTSHLAVMVTPLMA